MEIIVTKVFRNYRFGYQKLEEEMAFPSEADGMEWLKEEFFNNEYYNEEFTGELVLYEVEENSRETSISQRKFNFQGKEFSPEEAPGSDKEPEYDLEFVPKFSKGEIVVFNELASLSERTFQDRLAIVTGIPLTYAERKSQEMRTENLDYTDQMYMLEYITACGTLEHAHVLEDDLLPYEAQVPEELKILEQLSLHFKGIKPIDEEVLLAMMKGEVYMLNRKNWREVLSEER